MAQNTHQVSLDQPSGGIEISSPSGQVQILHPLWLRERGGGALVDARNNQRLYEPAELPLSLKVTQIDDIADNQLSLRFSDDKVVHIDLPNLETELGWRDDPQSPPDPVFWNSKSLTLPKAMWSNLDDPREMLSLLEKFYQTGFCIIRGTPTDDETFYEMINRFGHIRATNFGQHFEVKAKTNIEVIDLAYTDLELMAHSDNPYRRPVPGIQFLQCVENSVPGGHSTIVDGFAIADHMRRNYRDEFDALCQTPVRFRYESADHILQSRARIIECDEDGTLERVRFSSRVDYVYPVKPSQLDLYYAGRKRFYEFANSAEYQISFPFEPGLLLMMDNYRTLHGRKAFESGSGDRFLKGCYIDHDTTDGMYRALTRNNMCT